MTEFQRLEREMAGLILQTTHEVADQHQWPGGYACSCGHDLNSPAGFSRHLAEQVLAGLQPFMVSLQTALREQYDDAVAEAARREEERELECDSGEER